MSQHEDATRLLSPPTSFVAHDALACGVALAAIKRGRRWLTLWAEAALKRSLESARSLQETIIVSYYDNPSIVCTLAVGCRAGAGW